METNTIFLRKTKVALMIALSVLAFVLAVVFIYEGILTLISLEGLSGVADAWKYITFYSLSGTLALLSAGSFITLGVLLLKKIGCEECETKLSRLIIMVLPAETALVSLIRIFIFGSANTSSQIALNVLMILAFLAVVVLAIPAFNKKNLTRKLDIISSSILLGTMLFSFFALSDSGVSVPLSTLFSVMLTLGIGTLFLLSTLVSPQSQFSQDECGCGQGCGCGCGCGCESSEEKEGE